jgi:hypothetical protein
MRRVLLTLAAILATGIVAPVPASADPPSGPACYASSCDGMDPYTMRCANPNDVWQYHKYTAIEGWNNYIYLYYNPTCRAAWARTAGDRFNLAAALHGLGELAIAVDDLDRARELLHQAREVAVGTGHKYLIVAIDEQLATLCAL